MHAIAFETDVRQGIIRIPLQYRARLAARVKVILLQEGDEVDDRHKRQSSSDQMPDISAKNLPDGFYHPRTVPTYTLLAARDDIYAR